jgi:predicted regulator of Ras-like GTPase activity (Roadblock/LC7/MglB family)
MSQTFEAIFKNLDAKLKNVRALNLTTADGFPLYSYINGSFKIEEDKLSAVTSSLTALSHAAARQIMNDAYESTCIETSMGMMFMVQTRYQNQDCILSLISYGQPNLGQIRYYLLRLAKYLTTAKLSAEK